MLTVTITVKGGDKVNSKLKRLGSSLYNFSDAMKLIGQQAGDYYSNQAFNSQGGVFGSPWPALSPRTLAAKIKLYPQFANVPLVATGTMKDSFEATTTRQSVVISNTAPYYKYHQSTLPRRKIPRRQMAGINAPIKRIVKMIIQDDIKKKIRTA